MVRVRHALILIILAFSHPVIWTAERPFPDAQTQARGAAQGQETGQHGVPGMGVDACVRCHGDQARSYPETSHQRTSRPGSAQSILGSFRDDGSNVLMIADPAKAGDEPGLYFKMEAKPDGYYQTAVAGWTDQLRTRSERMEVVVGTGTRGQSYLYWHGDQLFELPVSFWAEGRRWINSPGYKNGTMNFSRPITPRCLECHATFAEATSTDPLGNRYHKENLVTGISCERCHGPSREHLALHAADRSSSSSPPGGQAIVNPAKLARDRQVDLCALCHNGIRAEEKAPAFSFHVGDALDRFLAPNLGDSVEHPDVHGNQVGLLKRSRCYLGSPDMSCSTCHEVHAPEHEAAWYSRRCLTCHTVESCGLPKTAGVTIAGRCVDCHMPVEKTAAFSFDTAGDPVQPAMRSHWIRVPQVAAAESR